ncbi:GGDEF domain-containing protein [Garciella nitratireducens]|uniref:Diguanylate cyclase (GGDEF) domain-containing protein n=1 Tax=Garciella nitratireducens DSM 15102 TaxID=1121911 RepID=A0A1T4NCT6_9FIRM|nr:GGDEF domain-containing protein [Garciella nitratireducens]SJZ76866.1 diguanylate cyclase (GGDEF) domain-containing protein [Garciella nitratireducens DSM 15102]
MKKYLTLEELLKKIDLITKLYHVVRIVDPVHKEAFFYENRQFTQQDLPCYSFWEKNKICENCISIQALEEEEVYAKVELKKEEAYLILSVPLQLKDRKVILELMQNVTKERVLFDSIDHFKEELYLLLKNRNKNIIKNDVTKLFNKRYIYERLPFDILCSNLREESFCLIMVRIDNLKEINKNYGQSCGDKILSNLANVLVKQKLMEDQWVARYSADTFIFVLNNFTQEQSKHWMENLKKDIKKFNFQWDKNCIDMMFSMGVYSTFQVNISMEELLHRVEMSLQRIE